MPTSEKQIRTDCFTSQNSKHIELKIRRLNYKETDKKHNREAFRNTVLSSSDSCTINLQKL